jgi:hypothetical protein
VSINNRSRPKVPLARNAEVGMPVRRHRLVELPIEQHVITRIYAAPGERYEITTTEGTWTFDPDELVTFPRRPDGSILDWRNYEPAPYPAQLAIGDLLNPITGPIPIEGPPDMTAEEYQLHRRNKTQHVQVITRSAVNPGIVVITTSSTYDKTRRWVFGWDEQVIFPHERRDRPTGYDPYAIRLEGYGPYLYVDPTTQDEYLYFLVTHPTGRGKWPAALAQPMQIGQGVYLAKPPAKGKDWPTYVGTGRMQRHPKDPAWGWEPTMSISPKRYDEAWAAYHNYQARLDSGSSSKA